jgi:ABC-2 type transport system permease protein
MTVTGVGVGAGAALSLHDAGQVGRALVAAVAQIPAAWVVTALVLATFGWLPRGTATAWGLLAAFVAIGELGELWNAPSLVRDLSPFTHSPLLPVTSDGTLALASLLGVAAVLTTAGYLGWLRRDLVT